MKLNPWIVISVTACVFSVGFYVVVQQLNTQKVESNQQFQTIATQLQDITQKIQSLSRPSAEEVATSQRGMAHEQSIPTSKIGAIFEPEINTNSQTAEIDKIKSDFESLFVTYQFLYKCGKTEPDDYHIINSALAHEIASKNAPGRIQYDILTAAKGSYQEIYSKTSCDAPEIAGMQQKFRDYINQVRKLRFVID